jgi:hypothetical protein
MSEGVEKLAYAVLLAASKQTTEFRIRPDGAEHVVEHRAGDKVVEEMRGPSAVLAAVIRRLSVMANLPTYKSGESASGRIHLTIGDDRAAYFAVVVSGHGPALTLQGRVLTEAEYAG